MRLCFAQGSSLIFSRYYFFTVFADEQVIMQILLAVSATQIRYILSYLFFLFNGEMVQIEVVKNADSSNACVPSLIL